MLVTLKQLEENFKNMLKLIKSYIDEQICTQLGNDASNIYCTAIKTPEEEA